MILYTTWFWLALLVVTSVTQPASSQGANWLLVRVAHTNKHNTFLALALCICHICTVQTFSQTSAVHMYSALHARCTSIALLHKSHVVLFCTRQNCHCRATHPGCVCAGPVSTSNSSELATLQEFAKGVLNLNAALRTYNLTEWEDVGSFCRWGGVACLVNTSQVVNLTLSSLQLEGTFALIRQFSNLLHRSKLTQRASVLAP